MEVAHTLTMFKRFRARHIAACAITRIDMAFHRADAATRIMVTCPCCRRTASGSINDADVPLVIELLSPGEVN